MTISSYFLKLILIFAFIIVTVRAHVDETSFNIMAADALEWPFSGISMYDGGFDGSEDEVDLDDVGDDGEFGRRSLFWRRKRYYISYGALSANRIPCPPRSGRSYYTHNCYKAHGPVHPYNRGCSMITRCRR